MHFWLDPENAARVVTHVAGVLAAIDPVNAARYAANRDVQLAALRTLDAELGRTLHKDVVVHSHFNHPNEITGFTEDALGRMTERGILVRCQTVLQRGVNDSAETLELLVKRLGYLNVQPYYVYMHDLVRGVEDLRVESRIAL